MTALDKMYSKVKQLQELGSYPDGISAQELAIHVGVKRSTASLYLNELAEHGRLEKHSSRPVRFSLPGHRSSEGAASLSVLDKVIGAQQSLKYVIDLCKSAVIYPPNGLPVLINGNSGTGKSFLASKIFEYAVQQSVIPEDAKYVELNCADYASNPELLSSVLFGHVKGAFTGASDTKSGLVAQADCGYLFLDEVHRLSYESQEKLFLLMDQGRYRMLGENSGWHTAKIRFIFATTENPNNVLLKTLLRRIPIQVTLPDWGERPLWERLQLIYMAYRQEAEILERDFYLPAASVNYLLQYRSDGNIGSVYNKIRISCAQAYKDRSDTDTLTVTLPSQPRVLDGMPIRLPDFIPSLQICRSDLNRTLPVVSLPFEAEIHSLVRQVETGAYETVNPGAQRLLRQMRTAAAECFPQYDSTEQADPQIRYYRKFIHNVLHDMAPWYGIRQDGYADDFLMLFLFDIFYGFELSEHEKSILAVGAEYYRRKTGYLTRNTLLVLQEAVQANYSFLMFFLPLLFAPALPETPSISAAIVSRGIMIASSIASTVNRICDSYIYDGLDMPIESNGISEIVEKVRRYISRVDTSGGLLLLVDRDSLDDMYEPIKNHLQGELAMIGSVSTNVALNLGHILSAGCDFNTLVARAKELTACPVHYYEKIASGDKMIISCISGVGIAGMIVDIFSRHIKHPNLEIVALDYKTLTHMLEYDVAQTFKDTRLVITINDITSDKVPTLSIHELPDHKGVALLKRQLGDYVDEERIRLIIKDIGTLFSVEGVASSLSFLDPHKVVADVGDCIEAYEAYYGVYFSGSTRMNIYLHMSLMVERLMTYGDRETRQASAQPSASWRVFEEISAKVLEPLVKRYNISINGDELEMIYEIVKYELGPHD